VLFEMQRWLCARHYIARIRASIVGNDAFIPIHIPHPYFEGAAKDPLAAQPMLPAASGNIAGLSTWLLSI